MALMAATKIPFYEFCSNDDADTPHWQPISSSHPPVVDRITSLRLLTWNIWFDTLAQSIRFISILSQILSIPDLDVVGLQEVTPEFLQLAKQHPAVQANWILTDYQDEQHGEEIESTWYGNVVFVRRKWAGCIRGWVKKFPTSSMNRFVVILEIFQENTSIVKTSQKARGADDRFGLRMHISIRKKSTKIDNVNSISATLFSQTSMDQEV